MECYLLQIICNVEANADPSLISTFFFWGENKQNGELYIHHRIIFKWDLTKEIQDTHLL